MELHKLELLEEKKEREGDKMAIRALTRHTVPGGWIYTATLGVSVGVETSIALSTCFVPDPEGRS